VGAYFSPGSFAQANFGAMNEALAAIQAAVPLRATVADLHCGVGVIGTPMIFPFSSPNILFNPMNTPPPPRPFV